MTSTLFLKLYASAVIAAVGSLVFVSEAQGAPELKVNVFSGGGNNNGTVLASSGTLTRATSGSTSIGSGTSRGSADFGVLRNYAQATAIGGSSNFNNAYMSVNETYFADELMIDAAGLSGAGGTLRVKFTIDGTLSASQPQVDPIYSQTYASASYTLSIAGYGVVRSGSEDLSADGTRTYDSTGAFLNLEQTADVPFTFGTPFTLKLTVGTGAVAYTQFGGTAIADLEHTAEWGGFASVRNGNGDEVQSYSISSGSGTNYVNPVPEPTGAAVLLIGVAGAALTRRRTTRTCNA